MEMLIYGAAGAILVGCVYKIMKFEAVAKTAAQIHENNQDNRQVENERRFNKLEKQ